RSLGETIGQIQQRGLLGFLKACFAAGTPLRTPEGSKPIEAFRPGDMILSRSELDHDARARPRKVEEVFAGTAFVWVLRVAGQEIRTTEEHPFYVQGKGWRPAAKLQLGDLLNSDDGSWVPVEGLHGTSEQLPVYNLRVAEYHTYFVGAEHWGFSVWAHN